MRVLPGILIARALLLTLAVLPAACSTSASDADAGSSQPQDAGSSQPRDAGSTPDELRAHCGFKAGARVTETLPITEKVRAAIPIKHVIVAMKENRSFDHLLGQLHDYGQPDAEAVPAGFSNKDGAGATVAPFHLTTTCVNKDPGHQWAGMHAQVNGGAMDGFVTNAAQSTSGDGHFAMGYYTASDLPFYYWLANTFAINDRHFASARSGTWPNRNFMLLGTADGISCTSCGLPDPKTPTLFQALDAAGVSWGVYTDSNPFDGAFGWKAGQPGLHTMSELLQALKDGTLPGVVFTDAVANVEDEHPSADVQVGEAWTRMLYEAIVASPVWPTSALVWTYDEGGGFWDHVPPPNRACVARPGVAKDAKFVELGVRVPLAVISPYARAHFVSHVVQDHTAITRFIEAVFDVPALTSRDANSDALLDMFDFQQTPALLHPPAAPTTGTSGCSGNIRLVTDHPSYVRSASAAITVDWSGVMQPSAHDRIGLYAYPSVTDPVPNEQNRLEPVAWSYIGGQGHMATGAPGSGSVVLDKSTLASGAAWPPAAGLWIVHYLPALANGADGHTPEASVDLEFSQ